MEQMYVAEFSSSQGAFHIETLSEAIQNNRELLLNKVDSYTPDYLPFALCETHAAATLQIKIMRNQLVAAGQLIS